MEELLALIERAEALAVDLGWSEYGDQLDAIANSVREDQEMEDEGWGQ